jgi:hypothetical protein
MDCDALRDDLLDVLYGEASPEARRRVAEHQKACAACREELSDFGDVRRQLSAWKLPASVVGRPRTALVPAWTRSPWLAVAASLLLALGSGLIAWDALRQHGNTVAVEDVKRMLDEQEARHQQAIRSLQLATATPASVQEQALLSRVQEMIQASEAHQAQTVNSGLAEIARRQALQRRQDLAQVSASFAYLEGKSGLEAARTTELMGRVLQASERR